MQCFMQSLVPNCVKTPLLMHSNRCLYVAAVGSGNAIVQALHAVQLLYGHVHEALEVGL